MAHGGKKEPPGEHYLSLQPGERDSTPINTTPPASVLIISDPDLKLPLTYQWNATIDRSLGRYQVLTAAYVGAAGRRLLRMETLINPNPNFVQVNLTRNGATSDYHALQVQFNRRLSKSVQALASYTWSHSIDTASANSAQFAPGSTIDPLIDRASSDFDIRHSFNSALSYNIPTFTTAPVVGHLLRDWSIDSVFTARLASPVNIFTTTDVIGLGVPAISRPDWTGAPLYIDDPAVPGGRKFNRAAFFIPPANSKRQGSLGRNALRGFNVSQLDFALRRELKVKEGVRIQIKSEIFNILNHPNFADPDGSLGTDGVPNTVFGLSQTMFGRGLGGGGLVGGLNPLYQVGGPRSMQFSLKVLF